MAKTVQPLSWFEKMAFLEARRVRVDPWDADGFEQLVSELYAFDDELREGLVGMVRERVAPGWRFVMLDPVLWFRVGEYLDRGPRDPKARRSWRPKLALRVWNLLPSRVRDDAGNLEATLDELAAALSEPGELVRPDHVSQVMRELVKINAVRATKKGRRWHYALNPVLATHGDEESRAYWQAKAGPVLLADRGELVRDPRPFTDPAQMLLFPDA